MNPYKQIFILLFSLLLFNSCKNSTEVVSNEPEEAVNSNQLVVQKSTFDKTNISLGEIQAQDFYDIVQSTGMIDVPMNAKAEVSPMVAGYVANIPRLIGESVKKGTLLLQLQNPDFIKMQQSYVETKEELVYLTAEFERQKLLSEENISSLKNFQKANSDYKLKQAQFNGIKETLKLLSVDLVQLEQGVFTPNIRIYAPIDGFIAAINCSIGSFVSPGDVLLKLINTSQKHLELEVFEKDVLKLEPGQQIRFRVPDAGNKYFEGQVMQINKSIDLEKRTLTVHGKVKNDNYPFLQGMYVEADILTNKLSGLAVPSRAVHEENGQSFILVYQSENDKEYVFDKVKIEVGRVSEQFTQVLSPSFQDGTKILDKGVFRLMGN